MASIKKIMRVLELDEPLKFCNAGKKTDKPREHKHRAMNFDRGWGPLTMKLPRDDIFLQATDKNKRGLMNGHYGINHLA